MLVPKRVKHRREFRGKMRGYAKGGDTISFGEYGLQATTSHWITNRQIEAARIATVSYTHLDVYKRQLQKKQLAEANNKVPMSLKAVAEKYKVQPVVTEKASQMNVLALGDSVMVAASTNLQEVFPHMYRCV